MANTSSVPNVRCHAGPNVRGTLALKQTDSDPASAHRKHICSNLTLAYRQLNIRSYSKVYLWNKHSYSSHIISSRHPSVTSSRSLKPHLKLHFLTSASWTSLKSYLFMLIRWWLLQAPVGHNPDDTTSRWPRGRCMFTLNSLWDLFFFRPPVLRIPTLCPTVPHRCERPTGCRWHPTESVLSALPPNYICAFQVFLTTPAPPTSAAWAWCWSSTDCLCCRRDWTGMEHLRGCVGLHAAYQTGTQRAPESRRIIISEWEEEETQHNATPWRLGIIQCGSGTKELCYSGRDHQ